MKSKFLVLGSSLVLALAAAGSAWADACPTGGGFPAQNANNCEDLGGTFSNVQGLRTCTVNKNEFAKCDNDFTATVQISTVYTREGNDCNTEKGVPEIIKCKDKNGTISNNSHCMNCKIVYPHN